MLREYPLTLRLFIPGTTMSSVIGPWDVDEIVVLEVEQERDLQPMTTCAGNARCRLCGGDYAAANLIDATDGSGEHVCKRCMKGMCPFCPLMGIEISMWQPIGNDFFGEPAKIGGIPSCGDCALTVDPEHVVEMVQQVQAK